MTSIRWVSGVATLRHPLIFDHPLRERVCGFRGSGAISSWLWLVLNRWMRTNGWTYQFQGTKDDIAYQSKIAAGLLEHKVETGEKPDGTTWTRTSVRVTPKGMLALAKAFPPVVTRAA